MEYGDALKLDMEVALCEVVLQAAEFAPRPAPPPKNALLSDAELDAHFGAILQVRKARGQLVVKAIAKTKATPVAAATAQSSIGSSSSTSSDAS